MSQTLLVVDIGNTGVTVGAYRGEELNGPWQLSTHRERTADEYGILFRGLLEAASIPWDAIGDMAVACVVPPAVGPVTRMAERFFGVTPLFIGPGVRTGISIRTENPQEVGADRIANAVSAFARYAGPTLVIDLGTATTFDAISADGEYLGGAIAPGVAVAAEALFSRTAKLPRVEFKTPPAVIGRNTVASIQSGLVHGYASLVDGVVSRMRRELAPPDGDSVQIVGTGGHATALAGECEALQRIDLDLTLDGLRRVWERNRGTRPR